jgi:crotonobetainyl-CoA hydratase
MVDPVRTEALDGVLVVTLDRPSANAIDVPTSHALHDASPGSSATRTCASAC